MALIDEVRKICLRMAAGNWSRLMSQHGLDLSAKDLAAELSRELPNLDRTLPGFEDFCADGIRAIEPGIPGRSLLYHAMASPLVHPPQSGVEIDSSIYPSLEEIDTIENYIYSLSHCRLKDFSNPVIAVFAYQYRAAPRTVHGLFADLTFSRTGVSRVGTSAQNYDRMRRSFWVSPPSGKPGGICVMPARMAAFVAVTRPEHASGVVLDKQASDKGRDFLFPVHKLFPGKECFSGEASNLKLEFGEYHRNEKLARIHSHGNIPVFPGFDPNDLPFIRDTRNSADLLSLQVSGGSVLVVPVEHEKLVRTASQKNAISKKLEILRFKVPPKRTSNDRYSTSLQIELGARVGRAAPEYVNIRHQVVTGKQDKQTLIDLNELPEREFIATIDKGGYEAAHFVDETCDGYVSVVVNGLSDPVPVKPAYSLVTAPDFFPLANQIEITRWAKLNLVRLQDHFSQGSPEPLSSGRLPANPLLQLDGTPSSAFDRNDETMTAVVGCLQAGSSTVQEPRRTNTRDPATTFLPDGASDVFAPGWDVSAAADSKGLFYAAFGLGSPFPEDAKLCAALNSFWPAVAPDATRTFGLTDSPTAIPMLDSELGLHPNHERVIDGREESTPGWDGEFGPYLERLQGRLFVNFANLDRSDYVSNAIAGKFTISGLKDVTSSELIDRMEALRVCIRKLPAVPHVVSATRLLLVTAEKVVRWELRVDKGDPRIAGPGYRYVLVSTDGHKAVMTSDIRRQRVAVKDSYVCQIAFANGKPSGFCFRKNDEPFQFIVDI
jgi:hypothetical protein